MAPKRSRGSSRAVARGINHEEEWAQSVSDEAALNALVVDGMLPDRVTLDGALRSMRNSPHPAPMN